jgi:hypothetical protein
LTLTPALGRGQCRQIAAERTRSSSGRIGAIDPEHTLAQGTMNDSSAPAPAIRRHPRRSQYRTFVRTIGTAMKRLQRTFALGQIKLMASLEHVAVQLKC